MKWRHWRQDLRLWLRRRSLVLSQWGESALSKRWVQQSLVTLGVLVLLAALHQAQGVVLLGSADRWIETSLTQPYDFPAAVSRVPDSPLWRAARVPELVELLRQALAVPTLAPGSQGVGKAVPALAQSGSGRSDGGETGLAAVMLPPVPGTVIRTFGEGASEAGGNTLFQGLELEIEEGMPVRAAAAGTVTAVELDGMYGRRVTIDHGIGLQTIYAFSGEATVKPQARLEQGDTLGTATSPAGGGAARPRVYFEIQVDGHAVDPAPFLTEGGAV